MPPPKEPTPIRSTIDRAKIKPYTNENNKKRTIIHVTKSVNRSLSEMSNDSSKKNTTNTSQDEIAKLKRRIEELEQQLKSSQKSGKEKDKLIAELNKNLENLNHRVYCLICNYCFI